MRERLGLDILILKILSWVELWSYDHKRLYSTRMIKRLAEDGGLKVLTIEALMHYCFPFNYHILRLGKLFYTKLSVPNRVKEPMKKLDGEKILPIGTVSALLMLFSVFSNW